MQKQFIKDALILTSVLFGLCLFSAIAAQTDQTAVTEVTAQDLGIQEPKVLPGNRFYFVKDWARDVQLFFTTDKIKKAELVQKFSSEKLLELERLVGKNANSKTIQKAADSYKNEVEKVKNETDKIKDTAETNPTIGRFLDKFTQQQVLQEQILQKLENQVPTEVFQKIKEAREKHLEKFGQVMQKLQNKEHLKERLQKYLPTDTNDVVKNFNNLEVLNRVAQKVPEQAKEAIQQVIQNATEKVQMKIEGLTPEQKIQIMKKIEDLTPRCQSDSDCPQPNCSPANNTRVAANCVGMENKCLEEKCVLVRSNDSTCALYYWFDSEHRKCGYKQFCGLFMYQGLQTFGTKEECLSALNAQ